jgi:hypothetical protein
MDHERAVASVVGAGVFQAESVRKLEVDLERGDLPAPSGRVADVHVDLGCVEDALPLGHEVVQARGVQRLLQGGLGLVPFLRRADELLRTGRQLRLELGQPGGTEQAQDELEQAGQLAAQLLTGAENVGIVLGFVDLAARHRACPWLPDGINRAMSTASGKAGIRGKNTLPLEYCAGRESITYPRRAPWRRRTLLPSGAAITTQCGAGWLWELSWRARSASRHPGEDAAGGRGVAGPVCGAEVRLLGTKRTELVRSRCRSMTLLLEP